MVIAPPFPPGLPQKVEHREYLLEEGGALPPRLEGGGIMAPPGPPGPPPEPNGLFWILPALNAAAENTMGNVAGRNVTGRSFLQSSGSSTVSLLPGHSCFPLSCHNSPSRHTLQVVESPHTSPVTDSRPMSSAASHTFPSLRTSVPTPMALPIFFSRTHCSANPLPRSPWWIYSLVSSTSFCTCSSSHFW